MFGNVARGASRLVTSLTMVALIGHLLAMAPVANATPVRLFFGSSSVTVACPVSVVYDGLAQTPCTVSVTGAGGLSLTPDPDYAANVSAGTATASYTFAGDPNHTGRSDSVDFTIAKATPVIGSSPPSDLTYGAPIPTDPAGATADVPGAFTYNPLVGTILHLSLIHI